MKAESRFSLPAAYCQKLPWVQGTDNIPIWLLEVVPGRYRVLPDSGLTHDALQEIRLRILEGPAESPGDPTVFEPPGRVALIGRLIPAVLAGPRPSWRFVLPKRVLPDGEEVGQLVLLFSLGYLEIWHMAFYNSALAIPLDKLI